jgi:hypothetical protein
MRLRLDQCFMRSVKDAPLSSHGDASMRHAQEKDAPLVNQCRRLLRACRTGPIMMAALRLAIVWSSRLDRRSKRAKPANREPVNIAGACRADKRSVWSLVRIQAGLRFDESGRGSGLTEVAGSETCGARIERSRLCRGAGFGRLQDAPIDVRVRAEMVEVARPPEGVARVGRAPAPGVIGARER